MWQSIPLFAYTLIKTCSFINNLVKRAEAVYVVNIYKIRKKYQFCFKRILHNRRKRNFVFPRLYPVVHLILQSVKRKKTT